MGNFCNFKQRFRLSHESNGRTYKEEYEKNGKKFDPRWGCKHYLRRCQLKCPKCEEFHPCRICHDIIKYDNETNHTEIHRLDPYKIKEIRCNYCKIIQKPTKNCENCKIEFAGYFCSKCNLYDGAYHNKDLFHCDKCNICWVGGRKNSFHCDTCQCCLSMDLKGRHACIKGRLKLECAICMEDFIYPTRESSYYLKCGHAIHPKCLN